MDHDVTLFAQCIEQSLGYFLFSLVHLGQGPVMRQGYMKIDMVVPPGAQSP
jgi:hypothetical protein